VRTVERVDLGRALFFDKRLSVDGSISCDTCHDLGHFGVDNERTSLGYKGQLGKRNAPTVMNAAGFFAQFWDGRAATIEQQATGPILNPIEMAMPDAAQVEVVLRQIAAYEEPFRRAFPADAEPRTLDNVAKALGAFERGLVTPGRWDQYLRGDKQALTPNEKEGLKTFLNVGCMVCHTGALLGGSMLERTGVVEPWPNQSDKGRYEVTHLPVDRMMFKVPTLRNVEGTGPYFHDGSAETIEDAVHMAGVYELGLDLSPREVASIVTWFHSLSGEVSASYVARPDQAPARKPATCGAAPLPDCPLQGWMKANAGEAFARSGDHGRLESSFLRMVAFAQPEYPSWVRIATAGARAAKEGDVEAVRAACKECHQTYRVAYRRDHRERALP